MGKPVPSKQRLEDLLALAKTYRNWSVREMAAELGRDPHNLVPNNGIPRVDLVLRLAEALEWTPQDVIDELCRETALPGGGKVGAAAASFDENNRRAFEAQQSARYSEMLESAAAMLSAATTAAQRSLARLRESAAWEGLGRYSLALQAVQGGLRERHEDAALRSALRRNLAYCHYALGNLDEASALATCLVAELQDAGPSPETFFEGSLGFVHYVRGSCLRVMASRSEQPCPRVLGAAISDLTLARSLLLRAADVYSVAVYRGVAKVCEGALLELAVLGGKVSAADAISSVLGELDAVVDPGKGADAAMLEAWGWWCVFGCNIALRSDVDASTVDRVMAILTNKADEIASHLGNWLLRERVWSLELHRREHVATRTGLTTCPTMDIEDTRTIVGTMARFPGFRATGWSILHSSDAVEKE